MKPSVRALGTVGAAVVAVVLSSVLVACAATQPQSAAQTGRVSTAAQPAASVTPLPTGGRFDYQLGGDYTPPDGVTIVSRDSSGTPAKGLYNICYINGFQTQGGDKSFWLKKHPTLVLRHSNGKPVFDPGWPDEMILNTSTSAKRTAITKVIGATISLCAKKGFQAVEFDNLDSFSRSLKKLTKTDNIAQATLFVKYAHRLGLAAGQKNFAELGSKGKSVIGFDFATAEECYRYDECASYTKVYGAQVLDIEYTDDLRGTFADACATSSIPPLTILRDRDLTTPSSKKYVYQSCS